MAKKFSIMDLMNDASRDEALTDIVTFDRVSVFDIEPNEKNEYSTEELENVKASIFAFGVQQPPLVVKQPLGSKYKYKAIAGHRRRLACIELVNEGYKEFEIMPVMVGENMDQDTQDALLVMTNSTQRVLSDWEKVMQHMKLKEIIPKMKKRQNMSGKTRSIESEITGVSEGQIAIYNTIGTKLNEWLMDWFKSGKIGISLAYEAAKLEPEQQEQLVEITKDKGNFTEEDIKQIVGSRPIEGQLKIEPEEKVTESDTFTEEPEISTREEKPKEIPYSTDNVDNAISLIFDVNEFPTDKFNELVELFRQGKDEHTGYISQQNVFNNMLPYQNRYVRIKNECGYEVEFIHTNRTIRIPRLPFWKAFEEYFEWEWEDKWLEEPENETVAADVEEEKVTESDTFEEEDSPAGEGKEPDEPCQGEQKYSQFEVKTYKQSGCLWHEKETIEETLEKIKELVQKYDDIKQISIFFKSGE